MSSPANEWLLANGHNNDGMCEKCWQAAAMMYACGQGPYDSQTDAYYAAMEESQCRAVAAIGESDESIR